MTQLQIFAFVVMPIIIVCLGYGAVRWFEAADDASRHVPGE